MSTKKWMKHRAVISPARLTMPRRLALLLMAAAWSHAAHAATISGTVRSTGGHAVRGALITLASADGLVAETVLSNAAGQYRVDTNKYGKLTLRARAPGMSDEQVALDLPAGAGRFDQVFSVRPLAAGKPLSDSLPAGAHFARLSFPTALARQQFQTNCVSCHQVGTPLTRRARSITEWTAVVERMLINAAYASKTDTSKILLKEYVEVLQRAFDGTPTVAGPAAPLDDVALRARITEWKLKTALIAHDSEFNPADGKYYTVDQGVDSIYITDPATDKTVTVALPPAGVPVGGSFVEQGMAAPYGLAVRHGAHSLQFGPDGMLYITGAIGGEIGVFDPKLHTYKVHRIGGKSLYPHTLRFDAKGMVWFTIAQSNQIGRFDPRTGHFKVIDLPSTMARKDERGPLPYGIDINPKDGSVWYSKLWGSKLGRIDAKSLAVQEFTPPIFGPRRLRFDASGALWIPGFGDGTLSRLDTTTMKYRTYQIPARAGKEVEAPYAVAIDPRTQDVWVTSSMSDRALRFLPKSGRFIAYPLPTRGTYFRDFFFPAPGRVCAPSSPMAPVAEVVEGAMDALVCIDTNDPARIGQR